MAAHPGYAATNLQLVGAADERVGPDGADAAGSGTSVFAQSAAAGALPSLYAATAPGVGGGQFFGPDRLFGMRGHPKPVAVPEGGHATPEAARRLWEVSEELTGVRFGSLDRRTLSRSATGRPPGPAVSQPGR